MKKFSESICKNKLIILIISVLLIIPALIGMIKTNINYNILVYLPSDIETVKGQDILKDDFDMGSFAIVVVDNSKKRDILDIEEKIKKVNGVNKVGSIDDVLGVSFPIEMLPSEISNRVAKDNSTLLVVTFYNTTSDSITLDAVKEIRSDLKGYGNVGGMSGVVLDTMELSNKEITLYVVIAVILCIIVLLLSLDSYAVPFIILINIGIAILYNMGTNVLFDNISYITKAISAVLQLGVTMDFSIFLYHKYQKYKMTNDNINDAMSKAISETLVSVLGSSLTTIAGFLALCTMSLTLGKDIGIVMAKGVLFGVICVVTVYPSLLLYFDKLIERFKHKEFVPKFEFVKKLTTKHYKLMFILFIVMLIPAIYGNANSKVYYNLDKSLPSYLESIKANEELKTMYNIVSPEIILLDKNIKNNEVNDLIDKLKEKDGIDLVLSYSEISKFGIPEEMLDNNMFVSDKYQMIMFNSEYEIATNELNDQIDEINDLVKTYDPSAIVAGEGSLTKDLIKISDEDFKNVNYASILVIFILMLFVLKSISLPIILVATIEFAIFLNVSTSYYCGAVIPFISSIIIGTIQLGATIDYGILMTTKYIEQRKLGLDKFKSISNTIDETTSSIFVSALCFFAATFGVSIYSKIDMIRSICTLIARGAIISMIVIIIIYPSMLLLFDKFICKTTIGFKKEGKKMKNKNKKLLIILLALLILPCRVLGLTKEETVYSKLDSNGNIKNTIVTERIINTETGTINDMSDLENIVNLNGNEEYKIDRNNLTWNASGKDIFYKGTTEKELPIKINIKYFLDGEESNVKDMTDKSGKVRIEINYDNTSSSKTLVNGKYVTLYTPFTITLGSIIDSNAKNVTVTNGKIINNGNSNMIVAIACPNIGDSLDMNELDSLNSIVIEYETSSYKFNSIYNVITTGLINKDDIEIFDKLDSVYSNISSLNSAINKIEDGSKELRDSINELSGKYNEFNSAIGQVKNGVNSLATNYNTLNNGITGLSAGINGLSNYMNGITSVSNSLKQISGSLNSINDLSSSINSLISGTNTEVSNHISVLKTIRDNTTDEDTKQALSDEINDLTSKLDLNSLNSLTSNISTLNGYISGVSNSTSQLVESSSDLTTLINTLSAGATNISNSSNQFNSGLNSLNDNISLIDANSNKLMDGINKLSDGSETLYSGIDEFNKTGISKLNSTINGTLKSKTARLEKTLDLGEKYKTFTVGNEEDTSTKFIMIVDK